MTEAQLVNRKVGDKREPVEGQCYRCGWRFIVMYTPMSISDAATCMQRATCPKCACKKILIGDSGRNTSVEQK